MKQVYEWREDIPFCEGLSDWIMLPKDCGPSSVVFSDIIMLQRCLNDIIMSLNSIYMLLKVFNDILMLPSENFGTHTDSFFPLSWVANTHFNHWTK